MINQILDKNRLQYLDNEPYKWNWSLSTQILNALELKPIDILYQLIILEKTWSTEIKDIEKKALNALHLHLNLYQNLRLKILLDENDSRYKSIKWLFSDKNLVKDLEKIIESNKHFSNKNILISFIEDEAWAYISITQQSNPEKKLQQNIWIQSHLVQEKIEKNVLNFVEKFDQKSFLEAICRLNIKSQIEEKNLQCFALGVIKDQITQFWEFEINTSQENIKYIQSFLERLTDLDEYEIESQWEKIILVDENF